LSITAIKWAYEQHCGSYRAKGVLVKLADNADCDGVCWPSISTIAEATELSRASVLRAIRDLEEGGFIKVIRNKVNGVNAGNKYRVMVTETASEAEGGVVSHRHQGGITQTPGVVSERHPNRHIEPSLNRKTPPDPPSKPNAGKKREPVQTQLPEGWTLPDESRDYAITEGLSDGEIERIAENFALHHRSKGNRFKSWHLAWCKWVRNEIKWAAERRSKARPGKGSGGRSSGGAYVDAYRRNYGSADDGGSDRGPDDGAVAPMGGDVPDPGEPAKSQGGVVIELFRGKGSADVRGHDDPAQVQQRRSGQGRPAVEGDCVQAVAVPGSGGWFGTGGMGGERGLAPGMGRSEAASGQSLQDPSGIDFSNGAAE